MGYPGTDGVAGVELTCELAFRLARAAGRAFRPQRVLLEDTRLSGPALASAYAAGLAEAGCDVDLAGVLPSLAVSHLVPGRGYGLGLVVSASHNPPQDNGVKLYGPHGLKLSPEDEARVEALLDAPGGGGPPGAVRGWTGAEAEYAAVLRAAVPDLSLDGLKLVLDCAHGATAPLAPPFFAGFGADVTVISGDRDGARINETGAAAMAALSREVPARGAEIGIAFDGDSDRALFVDRRGTVVEGDQLLAALAPSPLLGSCSPSLPTRGPRRTFGSGGSGWSGCQWGIGTWRGRCESGGATSGGSRRGTSSSVATPRPGTGSSPPSPSCGPWRGRGRTLRPSWPRFSLTPKCGPTCPWPTRRRPSPARPCRPRSGRRRPSSMVPGTSSSPLGHPTVDPDHGQGPRRARAGQGCKGSPNHLVCSGQTVTVKVRFRKDAIDSTERQHPGQPGRTVVRHGVAEPHVDGRRGSR